MTGSQFPRASSGQTIVIDGDLWNRLMDQVERNGRLYATPPLMMADNAGGKVLSLVRQPAGSSLARVKATSTNATAGLINCKLVTKDTTTAVGDEFAVQLVVSHTVGEVFYAAKSQNGTDNVGVDWIEHFTLKPTAQYQVLTSLDATLLPVFADPRFGVA